MSLAKLLHKLKRMADEFGVTVVISNQVLLSVDVGTVLAGTDFRVETFLNEL